MIKRFLVPAIAIVCLLAAAACRSVQTTSVETGLADAAETAALDTTASGTTTADTTTPDTTSPAEAPADDEPTSAAPEPALVGPASQPAGDLLCTPATGAITSLTPGPRWVDGDTRTYEIVQTDAAVSRGTPQSESVSMRAEATVTPSSTGDVRIEWEQGPRTANGFARPRTKAAIAAINSLTPLFVSYHLGPDGSWLGVENIDEVRAWAIDLLRVQDQTIDPEVLARLEATYERLGNDNIEALFAEYPMLLHSLEGKEFTTEPKVTNGEAPNRFGGAPIPTTITRALIEITDALGCAQVATDVTVDAEQMRRIAEETLQEAFDADNPPPLQFDAMTGRTVARIDPATGFVVQIESKTTIETGGTSVTETISITELPPPNGA